MKFPASALAAAVVGVALAAAPAAAEDIPVAPGQDYVQTATGMVFPPRVGPFQRTRIYRYAADGSDESAGYNLLRPNAEIAVTVYVYPSPEMTIEPADTPDVVAAAQAIHCSAQFDRVQQEIAVTYRDATLVYESETSHAGAPGYSATYTFTSDNFMGRRDQPLRSEAYLFCFIGGRWSVKYRFSYPAGVDAGADIAAFMDGLVWTIGQETPS